jgi:UDP-N-acetylglucosamine 1-carboxyvinyltransferase
MEGSSRGLILRQTERPLKGTIEIPGGKHAFAHSLAIVAMSDSGQIEGVPRIADAHALLDCIKLIYDRVELNESGKLALGEPANHGTVVLEQNTLGRSRNYYCLLPALLNRCETLILEGSPTGCRFQERPDEWYFQMLSAFGVSVVRDDANRVSLSWKVRRRCAIHLPFPSVTASVIALAASVASRQGTTLSGISLEPSVLDMIGLLRQGGSSVELEGRTAHIDSLGPPSRLDTVLRPDQETAVTLSCAAAIAGGDIVMTARRPFELARFQMLASEMGLDVEETGPELRVRVAANEPLLSVNFVAAPAPQVSSDWIPTLVLALAAGSTGISQVIDTMFVDRLNFLQQLAPLGLDTVEVRRVMHQQRYAALAKIAGRGRLKLRGGTIGGLRDLRGSAAVVLASLLADGPIVMTDNWHLQRGYEDLPRSLSDLGGLTYDYTDEQFR